ncbi:MAG TPA: glycine cleavage system protein GcvH [Phycisphaerae bacterium]|nr:glycine cleavage system protein GcvH [Phycisphaerae bacterium]
MVPKDLSYTNEHEWIRVEGGIGTVGITDHAQAALGDITFVELPPAGAAFAKGDELCAIESAKAAASIYAPAGGTIAAVNEALEDDPGRINSDCYGGGWICRLELSDPAEVGSLMDAAAYERFLAQEEH